jgi:transcription-repair coupling factor (superfamily II helicase)
MCHSPIWGWLLLMKNSVSASNRKKPSKSTVPGGCVGHYRHPGSQDTSNVHDGGQRSERHRNAPERPAGHRNLSFPFDEATIKRAIHNELERGGQTFFVHNKVKKYLSMAEQLRKLVPEANFEVAHGQMKPRELEDTMMRFLDREIDVLVCTTIIESGLDIPSANTIIINEADRLGLAQIYQLRGRVGRAREKAYAYLLISRDSALTRDAEKRLKALMDFSNLGAGLHLAMHDLKIRGGGNILGFSQSGHISAVGYELYLKLIERTVAELKGEQWQEEVNPEININIPAFLPGTISWIRT